MKKARNTLIPVVILFVIAMAGIGIYYQQTLARSEAERVTPAQLQAAATKVQVSFRVSVPQDTPDDQLIYISGSSPAMGSWDAAGVALQKGEGDRYGVTVELIHGVEYGYKVTRGTWGTVERGPNDTDLPNRVIRVEEPTDVDVDVVEWIDKGQSVPGRVTLTGDIRFHRALPGKGLRLPRDLIVWLPPDYEGNTGKRYPVLYLQDGQNLFDESTSYQGVEWRMDESAQAMIGAGAAEPFIVVGISNTEDRTEEFTPGTDAAKAFADFLAKEAKPFIDSHYRTVPDAAHTTIGGAGLGAFASLMTVDAHPETFGQIVCLVPEPWDDDAQMLDQLAWNDAAWTGVSAWVDQERLAQRLESAGLAAVHLEPTKAGPNSEKDWAEAMPRFLSQLYGIEKATPHAPDPDADHNPE